MNMVIRDTIVARLHKNKKTPTIILGRPSRPRYNLRELRILSERLNAEGIPVFHKGKPIEWRMPANMVAGARRLLKMHEIADFIFWGCRR